MIALRLQGGLGNQLFQFAFGYEASRAAGRDLVFDTRLLHKIGAHAGYELDRLGIDVSCDPSEVQQAFSRARLWWLERLPRPVRDSLGYVEEPSLNQVKRFGRSVLLIKGYWQSSSIAAAATSVIVDGLSKAANKLHHSDEEMIRIIAHENAVAVHARRGDYISNKKVRALFGPCELSYFELGIDLMRARLERPFFFVFSDDPSWAQSAFSGHPDVRIVSSTNTDSSSAVIDLCRMSRCQHFVLSNSSLSWWAAHLSNHIRFGKPSEVIYPSPWFDAPALSGISGDLPKAAWIPMPKRGAHLQ